MLSKLCMQISSQKILLLWCDLTTVTEFKSDSLTRLNLLYHDFIELMDVAAIDIILT